MVRPEYKTVRILFADWQMLTRICSLTGEPRTRAFGRMAREELARLTCQHSFQGSECCALCGASRKE